MQQYGMQQYGMQRQGTHPPCPKCGHTYAQEASFTWWGGVLGPKLFSHVNCLKCNTGYNGKTGQSNNTKIAVYVGVLTVVSIGIAVAASGM
ncbi:MAG TPA: hypothetical protein ENK23_07740 [Sorangium sp.]|nr:hypothetical protein [Sorangium sp.]